MTPAAVLAGTDDIEVLSDTLQAAFWDDPVMTFLLPDEASRSRRSAWLFRALLTHRYIPMRTTWTTPDQVGAALWAPPGHWRLPPRAVLRSARLTLRGLGRRTFASLRLLEEVERHHPTEPHWYLSTLGTTPHAQGHGVGSALLEPVLTRCDAEGVPAYLESSKESNLPFYARHGFKVTEEIRAGRGAPVLWAMWRDA